jgi:hypothetical protein
MKHRVTMRELEAVLDLSGISDLLEARLPKGVRKRQLPVRTFLLSVLLCVEDDKPLFLTHMHDMLVELPLADRRRLGITTAIQGCSREHTLSYRQMERTARLVFHTVSATPVPSFRKDRSQPAARTKR